MDKKSTKLLHNPVPLKIRTEEDIERERKDFFRNCERISRAPASIFLDGNRFSRKAKLFALPFYAYAGIEKGHYERFMYEESEWRNPSGEKTPYFIENGKIRKRLPYEEKVMFKSETPISSIRDDRMLNYQIYFNEELKKYLIRKEEIEKLIQKGESFDSIINRKKVDFKELEPKFKNYFKIKVWSEIPPYIGLNEGAAIATAVAFLVELELFPTNVNRAELIQKFLDLKINRPEEIIVDWLFMGMFSRALQFDFFSNGAAVFASIMGNSRKQDTINYECLFYSEMKRFFEPRPEISHKDIKLHMQAFEKIRKVKGINAYFDECSNLSKKTLDTTPLFDWNYSKLDFKNKQELALSVMERRYISGDDRDFKVPSDSEIELHLLSQVAFAVIGDPSTMVLCERNPEKYIFGTEKERGLSNYSLLYGSRTDGWEVQGASVTELKKPKEILEEKRIESNKAILDKYDKTIQKWLKKDEKLDYASSLYFDGYFVLRVKEKEEFVLVLGDHRKGRIIFAKETKKGVQYLYDSVQLYRDWYPESKDFLKLSAIDINIYLHLIISLVDDMTAIGGIMMGVADYVPDMVCKYLTLNPEAKGENAGAVMQRCANFFLYPHFCYTTFYLGYKRLNMAREAGIAHEMMGKTSGLKIGGDETNSKEDRIEIGFGLMLQGKFEEAIEVFKQEYDSCVKEFYDEKSGNKKKGQDGILSYSLTRRPYSDILIAEGYMFWAFGMAFWVKEKKKDAEKSFKDSYDALSRAYSDHKNEPMPFLLEHLLTELRKGSNALGMDEQLKFMNEWSEKRRKEIESEEETKTEKRAGLTEEVLEKVTSIDSKIAKFVELKAKEQVIVPKEKTKKKEPEGEKAAYEEQIGLEKSTLEIDYLNEEPIIKINGKIVEEFKPKEKNFSRFVRLAVARKVNELGRNGRIYKYDEPDETEKSEKFNLYIGGIRQKNEEKKQIQKRSRKRDKELYDLRKFLEKDCRIYGLNEEAKKKLIVSRKGSNEVNLGILQENITINVGNLKKFKSNLRSIQTDKYGTSPSEINERLIKDALEAYKNPLHKI